MADANENASAAPASVADAAAVDAPKTAKAAPAKAHFEDKDGLFKTVCRASMSKKKCKLGAACKYVHDPKLCAFFYRSGVCKFGDECRQNHFVTLKDAGGVTDAESSEAETKKDDAKSAAKEAKKKKNKKASGDASAPTAEDANGQPKEGKKQPKAKTNDAAKKTDAPKDSGKSKKKPQRSAKKNTECFEPMTRPVDLRVTYDLGSSKDTFSTSLTTRDVLLAPNLFSDFKKGELYAKLVAEIESCGVPPERLLKMWHGNDKIDGTHLIADDKTRWKTNCPTFELVIERIKAFFKMSVKATRFNWYKDTSQWKPFHFDAAAVKPEIAAIQNFTVGVSFGATRDAAFEHADTRTVVSIPQPDGCVYAFARDTNVIWRHGILQDAPVRDEGRISVIAWGWIDGMVDPEAAVTNTPREEKSVK